MKSTYLITLCIVALLFSSASYSQVYIYPGAPHYYRPRPQSQYRPVRQPQAHFDPYMELSLGYGFPNLDASNLPSYYQAYHTSSAQVGPFTGSLNYRFSKHTSVGVLVTHGILNAPYYAFNSSSTAPLFNAKFDNWAFMLNIVNYLPGNNLVSPYTKIAIGVNSWQQNYTDASGNKLAMQPTNLPDLAYQLSLGAKFKLSKNTGFFAEAGYGKYIVEGGLTFKL